MNILLLIVKIIIIIIINLNLNLTPNVIVHHHIFYHIEKSKCALQNTIKYVMEIFDDENDNIDELKEINLPNNNETNNENKKYYHKFKNNIQKINIQCYRCGRKGHYKNECHAKTHIYGYLLK